MAIRLNNAKKTGIDKCRLVRMVSPIPNAQRTNNGMLMYKESNQKRGENGMFL